MKMTVTMVLPDGVNRWYIEGLVEGPHKTLTEELEELERTDPVVAEAGRKYRETVADIVYGTRMERYQAHREGRCDRAKCEYIHRDGGEPKPKRSLHLNLKPNDRVPMIGDVLVYPSTKPQGRTDATDDERS